MSFMFAGTNINYNNLLNINLNTDDAKNISYMFYQCSSLSTFNFSLINTSNVEDMSHLFDSCESLIDIKS